MKRDAKIRQYEKVCKKIGDFSRAGQILPFRTICGQLHCDYEAVEEIFLCELGMTGEDYLKRLWGILPEDERNGNIS
ncbi:MAG: hypothetical protein ACI3ZQ_07050 [Candidatus Cryptobacteroides sp.]